MRKDGVQLMVDLDGVAEFIGAMEGAAEASDTDKYMGELLHRAHGDASDEFDLQLAAEASATHAYSHMYEWGTAGINTGRTTRRMNPLNPESRLWRHVLEGTGKNVAANYTFAPSKVPVPAPTTASTGIAQKYLSRLKKGKHIFWNKASVMELGTTVTISPKASKLFIPHNGNPPAGARPQDVKRGFTMTSKSVRARPGKETAGNFELYWQRFWAGRGNEIMQENVQRYLEEDIEKVSENTRTRGTMGPPSATAFKAAVKKGKKTGASKMQRSAQTRRAT